MYPKIAQIQDSIELLVHQYLKTIISQQKKVVNKGGSAQAMLSCLCEVIAKVKARYHQLSSKLALAVLQQPEMASQADSLKLHLEEAFCRVEEAIAARRLETT